MSQDLTRLEQVADLVIRRVLSEPWRDEELAYALERAYPFGDLAIGRSLWEDALERNKAKERLASSQQEPLQY